MLVDAGMKPVSCLRAGDYIQVGAPGRWCPVQHVDRSHDGAAWRDIRILVRDGWDVLEFWLPSSSMIVACREEID